MSLTKQSAVDSVYDEFWKDIIEDPEGLNLSQIKKELYDFWVVMEEVSKVYLEISNYKFSKPTTSAEYVLEEHYARIREAVAEILVMDKYQELLDIVFMSSAGITSLDITPEEFAEEIKTYEITINRLVKEFNNKSNWLDHIFRFSRGKAREWAREALLGNTVLEYFDLDHL